MAGGGGLTGARCVRHQEVEIEELKRKLTAAELRQAELEARLAAQKAQQVGGCGWSLAADGKLPVAASKDGLLWGWRPAACPNLGRLAGPGFIAPGGGGGQFGGADDIIAAHHRMTCTS